MQLSNFQVLLLLSSILNLFPQLISEAPEMDEQDIICLRCFTQIFKNRVAAPDVDSRLDYITGKGNLALDEL